MFFFYSHSHPPCLSYSLLEINTKGLRLALLRCGLRVPSLSQCVRRKKDDVTLFGKKQKKGKNSLTCHKSNEQHSRETAKTLSPSLEPAGVLPLPVRYFQQKTTAGNDNSDSGGSEKFKRRILLTVPKLTHTNSHTHTHNSHSHTHTHT